MSTVAAVRPVEVVAKRMRQRKVVAAFELVAPVAGDAGFAPTVVVVDQRHVRAAAAPAPRATPAAATLAVAAVEDRLLINRQHPWVAEAPT